MYDNQHKSKLQNLSFNGTQPNFEAISHQEKRGQNYFHLFSFNQYIKRHKKTGMHFENFYFWYYWHALMYILSPNKPLSSNIWLGSGIHQSPLTPSGQAPWHLPHVRQGGLLAVPCWTSLNVGSLEPLLELVRASCARNTLSTGFLRFCLPLDDLYVPCL